MTSTYKTSILVVYLTILVYLYDICRKNEKNVKSFYLSLVDLCEEKKKNTNIYNATIIAYYVTTY